jgi:hypothetical protein
LKRYRFDVSAAPFSKPALLDYSCSLHKTLQGHLADCHLMFPARVVPALELLTHLGDICDEGQDYLLQAIVHQVRKRGENKIPGALLIKESRLVRETVVAMSKVSEFAGWTVLHPMNLRAIDTYRSVIVVGPPYWFPDHVFSAPRAAAIDIICYDWIRVHWEPQPVFVAPTKSSRSARQLKISHIPDTLTGVDDELSPPTMDLDRVVDSARREYDRGGEDDSVEALLLGLEGDHGVFIEVESSVLVIDLSEEAKNRVKRISYRDLGAEIYILLRTSGGGDYIVPVADRILGDEAEDLREMQQTWKARLRGAIKKEGIHKTIDRLKTYGSKIASYQNVRNWSSDRNIITKDPADFRAIMTLTDLEDQADNFWTSMKKIQRAHARAGQHIRRLLLQEINHSDLLELERTGVMEFSLPDRDAGSLTAYRIVSIASRMVEVASGRIDEVFRIEDV